MSDSEDYQSNPDFDEKYGSEIKHSDFFSFNSKSYENSRKLLANTIKYAVLYGADIAFMSKNSSARSKAFNQLSANIEACKACEKKTKAKYCVQRDEMSKIVKFPSGSYANFPLNLVMFSAVLVLRLISIQFSIFTAFVSLPITLSYSLIMLPIQTIMGMRKNLLIRVSMMWVRLISHSTSFIYSRLVGKRSIVNLGLKLSRALFWSIGICFVLMGLLCSGFLVGGVVIRRLVEKPIKTTEILNFDYTKDIPVAFVPINHYAHKLQITVALTLPESEYNRKLGMFQVRLELFSANGKVIASSNHPCLLKYKSPSLRFIETILKIAPLLAGFQAESQTLTIKTNDLAKAYEPSGYLKVALEQRAEYNAGVGIPQIYDASLIIESELSKLKNIIWLWRRTIFVWIGFTLFWTQLAMLLIFSRCYIMPQGRVKIEKECNKNRISWFKIFL